MPSRTSSNYGTCDEDDSTRSWAGCSCRSELEPAWARLLRDTWGLGQAQAPVAEHLLSFCFLLFCSHLQVLSIQQVKFMNQTIWLDHFLSNDMSCWPDYGSEALELGASL